MGREATLEQRSNQTGQRDRIKCNWRKDDMSEELKHGPINNDRRRFMCNAAMTLAVAEFVAIGSAVASVNLFR